MVGLGGFGKPAALALARAGFEVIAIDVAMRPVDDVKDDVALAVRLDATDEAALAEQGVGEADLVIATIGANFEAQLLTVVYAKQLGVDRVLADKAGIGVGDTIDVLGRRLAVERIEPGGTPIFEIAFMSGEDAREVIALDDYVSFFLLATEGGANTDRVARAAVAEVPGSESHTAEDFAAATRNLVEQGFLPVVGALVGIGFAIGGAVIALTIYTATIERARDFGVLKAIGADDRFVYRIVVEQSLGVGVVGAALGIALSTLAATLIRQRVPEFVTDLQLPDAAAVFAIAVLVSAVAAIIPVRRISRIDPAMVFRA